MRVGASRGAGIALGIALGIAAALAAGCGGGQDREAGPGEPDTLAAETAAIAVETVTCSAAGLDPAAPEQAGLPPAVAETRRAIVRAAVACDYDGLESLALRGGAAFTYSFGDDARPAQYWRENEAAGESPMAMLVRTLSLPWARETLEIEPYVYYVWPSAYLIESTDEDWAALAGLYSAEEIETMRDYGSFIGWRVGITETGDWRFFVAGD